MYNLQSVHANIFFKECDYTGKKEGKTSLKNYLKVLTTLSCIAIVEVCEWTRAILGYQYKPKAKISFWNKE